jgi:phosphatidylinositol phospholipase C delta
VSSFYFLRYQHQFSGLLIDIPVVIKTLQVFLRLHPKSYPLILSLENHCSIPYQHVMAIQLKSILGDKLYIPEEKSLKGPLPSPLQ